LSQLTKTRDSLRQKRDNLVASLEMAEDVDTRTTLLARAKELGEMIAEAERDLTAYARLAADWEGKRAILANVAYQMRRYRQWVLALKVDRPEDAPFIRNIILSLEVTPIVRSENGVYKVTIVYNLGEATAKPWFTAEDAEGLSKGAVRQHQL
jgi:hypothetical protein